MEKYFFTKENVDSEILTEAIQLRTTLRTVFLGCLISEERSELDVILDDNIEVQFSRALISTELDEITNIINIIGPSYDLVIRKSIELNTMSWAIKTGQQLMAQLGANNLYAGKTAEQVHALATAYPELIHSMITGSLATTYGIFLAMVPDANITQEEIDEFTLRLKVILGIE